jgi:hypothetical protein
LVGDVPDESPVVICIIIRLTSYLLDRLNGKSNILGRFFFC